MLFVIENRFIVWLGGSALKKILEKCKSVEGVVGASLWYKLHPLRQRVSQTGKLSLAPHQPLYI